MTKNLKRILFFALISLPLAGQAARTLGPPIAEFFKDDNRVARGTLVEKSPGNKITIRVDEFLYQEGDDQVTLTVGSEVLRDLTVGSEYLFVFSRMRKNPLLRDEWEVNPEGPGLVNARGLGTPAIYENNAVLQTLLTPPVRRGELTVDAETSMLLSVAESKDDDRARELVIFELFLRPDLQSAISADNAERYAALAATEEPRLKNFMLQGARNFPKERRATWLRREYVQTATVYGAELELNSDVPLLLKNSLLGLRDEGTVDDLQIIGKHLYSNGPGVARAALTALDAIDSDQALVLAKQAVKSDKIHVVTRRGLTAYIKKHS